MNLKSRDVRAVRWSRAVATAMAPSDWISALLWDKEEEI
jgi:hypothetical protein